MANRIFRQRRYHRNEDLDSRLERYGRVVGRPMDFPVDPATCSVYTYDFKGVAVVIRADFGGRVSEGRIIGASDEEAERVVDELNVRRDVVED